MHMDAADLNLDAVLVHVPRLLVRDPVLGRHARVNFPAAGLVALAGELERRGRRCRIVHLGAEKLLIRVSCWRTTLANPAPPSRPFLSTGTLKLTTP